MSEIKAVAPLEPRPDRDSKPFWDGCQEGKLLLQRCVPCGHWRYPPRPGCPHCGAPESEWVRAGGQGFVYSWFIVHHPTHPSVRDKVPYNVVLVELDEGPRIVSQLVDVDFSEIHEGLRVQVTFHKLASGFVLPWFRPQAEGADS